MNNNAEHDVQVNKLFTFPTFCYDLSSASVLCVLLSDKKKITCLKFSFYCYIYTSAQTAGSTSFLIL